MVECSAIKEVSILCPFPQGSGIIMEEGMRRAEAVGDHKETVFLLIAWQAVARRNSQCL